MRAALALLVLCLPALALAAPASVGQACALKSDCVTGLRCLFGTCEYPGGCRTKTRSGDEPWSLQRPAYDAAWREIARVTYGGEAQPTMREHMTWSSDGLTQTTEMLVGSPLRRVAGDRITFDAEGRRLTTTPVMSSNVPMRVYDWSRADGCSLAPGAVYADATRAKRLANISVECADGLVRVERTVPVPDADIFATVRRFDYDAAGRMIAMHMERTKGDFVQDWHYKITRAADGREVTFSSSATKPRPYASTEVRDHRCWQIGPAGLEGGPHSAELTPSPLPKGQFKALVANTWWRVSGDDARFRFEVDAERILVQRNGRDRPVWRVTTLSERDGALHLSIKDGEKLGLVIVTRVDDDTLLVQILEGPEDTRADRLLLFR